MKTTSQSGSGTLVMVMLIAIVGLLLMSGLQRQLDAAVRMGNDERHYLRAFNQALSSLNWAMSVRWHDTQGGWQCQRRATENLKACLRKASDGVQWLLRGEGQIPTQPSSLVLYQRVAFLTSASERTRIQLVSQGWLDFCPDKDSARCADSE